MAVPTVPTPTCPYPGSGFDCARQRAFAAAEKYLAGRPGHTAVVVRDRATGAVWRNAHTTRPIWTASTIKLAIAVDLLVRDHAGAIRLAAGEHTLVQRMLRASSDSAATTLWWRYDGRGAPVRYDAYGMTGLTFPGDVYWGSAKATADDLDRLVNHTLDALPAHLSSRIVADLRAVTPNQQWGVWGVGPASAPGNTNGWWGYSTGWVINSVGFLGPGHRYTLTLMNDLAGEAGYDAGVATTTRVAALIFAKTL